MSVWWDYFWPVLGAGLVIGIIAGAFGFRTGAKRNRALLIGAVAALVATLLWHGPLGAADRFKSAVERNVRATLIYYEMTQVTAHLHQQPLTRQIELAGPADDFQSSELVRVMSALPGVSSASWTGKHPGLPLIAQALIACVGGLLIGLAIAYLVELRRRYNAQWKW